MADTATRTPPRSGVRSGAAGNDLGVYAERQRVERQGV
jgi:hypothetical protein